MPTGRGGESRVQWVRPLAPPPLIAVRKAYPGAFPPELESLPSDSIVPSRLYPRRPLTAPRCRPPPPRAKHDMNQAGWTGKRTDMLPEIAAAVGFLSSLLRTRGCVSEQRLKVFSGALQEALTGEPRPRGAPRTPPLRLGSLPCLERPSCPPSTGVPMRAAPGLGFPPARGAARRPPLLWVTSPFPALRSGLGPWWFWWGAAGADLCPGVRFRFPGLCPRRAGTCGSECGPISRTGL